MEEDYGFRRSSFEGCCHAREIQTLGGCGEVGVCGNGEINVGKDLVVVGPCWVTEVDARRPRVEFTEEEGTKVNSTCTGDGLYAACAVFCKCW